ncbi:MAG: hypothetical protein D6759_19560, partial [Chloroflexi bacterium]
MTDERVRPPEPELVEKALTLRRRTRRLAHLSQWPIHLSVVPPLLLVSFLFWLLRRLPIPDTVSGDWIPLFWLGMVLLIGLAALLTRAIHRRLRRALHLETWPTPQPDFSLRAFALALGTLALTFAVHALLGKLEHYALIIPFWLGSYQLIAAWETRVERYAVQGIGCLLVWSLLMGMPVPQASWLLLPSLALVELVTALWGRWEWH